MTERERVVALSGGVGGAKLALGLSLAMADPAKLTVIVNTGDDFEHMGLLVCPDADTLLYTLGGLANADTGWGRGDESWTFMDALGALGGETWFRLGDRDLALHALRTSRWRAGEGLGAITADVARRLGIAAAIVPATDDAVRTTVETDEGPLAFQHYFVREQCRPRVTGFRFEGAQAARPGAEALAALADPALSAVVICPSNPFISIDPILAVPGLRAALEAAAAPVVAVSPIVGGRAIKGPTAKMLGELGLETSALAVARHYSGLLDGFVLDQQDADAAPAVAALGMAVRVAQTVMRSRRDREDLARIALDFASSLREDAAAGGRRRSGPA